MDLDDELCYCFHVTRRKLVNFARQTRPRRPSQLSQCFGAGSGCGWCIPFLVKLHREVVGGASEEAVTLTPEEYQALRAEYRKDVAAGGRRKNHFEDPSAAPPGGPPAAPRAAEPPLDYTSYFSRARPDPEPETLGGGAGDRDEDLEPEADQ